MRNNMCEPMMNAPATCREIVAAVITHEGDMALLRRSALVTGDIGRWNCITGFREKHASPLEQAFEEIREEAGIGESDLRLASKRVLLLKADNGQWWRVHAFHFVSNTRALCLNWENDACAWVPPHSLPQVEIVPWLTDILDACGVERTLQDYA